MSAQPHHHGAAAASSAHDGHRPDAHGTGTAVNVMRPLPEGRVLPQGGRSPATQRRGELASTHQHVEGDATGGGGAPAAAAASGGGGVGLTSMPAPPRRPSTSMAVSPKDVAIKQVAKMFMVRGHTHTYTHTHTYIHTYIHTYTHTHPQS